MVTTFADISHRQAIVDLTAYAAEHDRIVLKATEATGYIDPTFAVRWRVAERLGLARVAYHYDRARFDGAEQFDYLLAAVQAAGGLGVRDRLCLDSEDTNYPAGARMSAATFGARAVARGHHEGIVYTGRWYAEPNRITADVFPIGWRQLWLSHYDLTVPNDRILMPTGWARSQCVARQFTDRAPVAGVSGACDYSVLFTDWIRDNDMPLTDADIAKLNDAAKAGALDDLARRIMVFVRDQSGLARPVDVRAAVTPLLDDETKLLSSIAALRDLIATGNVDEQALADHLAPLVGPAVAAEFAARLTT